MNMTFKYEDARKDLKDRLERTSAARTTESVGTTMVPTVWANQVIKSVREAANGDGFTQVSGTTKAAKLANAEASLHLLTPAEDTLTFEMIRFPEKEFVDLIRALELLARKVRLGEWRLSLPEYERLAEELVNDFSKAYGLFTTRESLFDRYLENRPRRFKTIRTDLIGHGWPSMADRKIVEKALNDKAKGGN